MTPPLLPPPPLASSPPPDALDKIDIIIFEPRAIRLFRACDIGGDGAIGITDFEIGLMINDLMPNYGLTLVDAFFMFDEFGNPDSEVNQAPEELEDDGTAKEGEDGTVKEGDDAATVDTKASKASAKKISKAE